MSLGRRTIVVLLISALASGQAQKLGSSIIRNGSTIWEFYTSSYDQYFLTFQSHGTICHRRAMSPYEPTWAHVNRTNEAYPDINLMSNGKYNLYFVAPTLANEISAIGVATAQKLDEEDGLFTPQKTPLIVSENEDDYLSHPNLIQESGILYLYYYNSSSYGTSNRVGSVNRVRLSIDGLRVV